MALNHVNLIRFLHTACNHFMACSVDGRTYTQLAWHRMRSAFFDGRRSCHCPPCLASGIWYWPLLSCMLMIMGLALHVIRTSVLLCTVTPFFVKMETVPVSAVLPMLIRVRGKWSKVSALVALGSSMGIGNHVTLLLTLTLPLATPIHFWDTRRIGRPALVRSILLM